MMNRHAAAWCGALVVVLLSTACAWAAEAESSERVKIESVEVALTSAGPIVLLKAEAKAIPVFVDHTVAESIHAALTRQRLPRPLSHDLMRSILQSYGGKVTQVVVTLKGSTYHAALSIDLGGASKVFDSRSSDAIALAIHFSAPILVSRELLESAGKTLDTPPDHRRL
ncbi:MAG: bifunctional nuclease family protein [Burkholderiales bacterium]|nr:bifunctional nuclease family protein [Burkholderiales bacterium]